MNAEDVVKELRALLNAAPASASQIREALAFAITGLEGPGAALDEPDRVVRWHNGTKALKGRLLASARAFLNHYCELDATASVPASPLFEAWHHTWVKTEGNKTSRGDFFYAAVGFIFPPSSHPYASKRVIRGIRLKRPLPSDKLPAASTRRGDAALSARQRERLADRAASKNEGVCTECGEPVPERLGHPASHGAFCSRACSLKGKSGSMSRAAAAKRLDAVQRYVQGESAQALGKVFRVNEKKIREYVRTAGVALRTVDEANALYASRRRSAAVSP